MFAVEVIGLQSPAQPRFKTSNTKTAAPAIHVRSFPYMRPDDVDFRAFINLCRDAPKCRDFKPNTFRVRNTRRGVDAAIDALPIIGSIANRSGSWLAVRSKSAPAYPSPMLPTPAVPLRSSELALHRLTRTPRWQATPPRPNAVACLLANKVSYAPAEATALQNRKIVGCPSRVPARRYSKIVSSRNLVRPLYLNPGLFKRCPRSWNGL